MDIEISHLTRFDYDHEVQLQLHLLYLRPRESAFLEVIHLDFSFTPEAKAHWMRDDFDNLPATLQFSSDASHEASVSSKPLPGTISFSTSRTWMACASRICARDRRSRLTKAKAPRGHARRTSALSEAVLRSTFGRRVLVISPARRSAVRSTPPLPNQTRSVSPHAASK